MFALGFVTLLLSQYILPEDLYPWLNLVSGLLVVTVGLGVLRASRGAPRAPSARTITPSRTIATITHHGHEHSHDVPDRVTWRAWSAWAPRPA